MMRKMVFVALLALPFAASAVPLQADPAHSTAGFAVKHMKVTTVRGQFDKFTSTLDFNEKDPSKSSVTAEIDANTIDTRQESRDKHLKSAEFFDVAKYPTITFKSTKWQKGGNGYKVTGDLTMHGVTKPVTLQVETDAKAHKTPMGGSIYNAHITGNLKRSDFGLTWNKTIEGGGVLVSDDVALEIDAEYAPPKASAAK
jgi:polyisoprenoid-binding protein YceI